MPPPYPFAERRREHLRLGSRGETLAARILEEIGVEVLLRNYRTPDGEIDLVAREHGILCFVEVKTRRRALRARPADAVGIAKRQRIARAAHRYLREIGFPPVPYRYDIVELIIPAYTVADARYYRGAFTDDRPARRI